MKSFLRRKQALVIAIVVLATVIGLGLSTGIARAAPTADTLTINPKAKLSQNVVSVQVTYTCSARTPPSNTTIGMVVNQDSAPAQAGGESPVTCDGSSHTATISTTNTPTITSGTFTKGTATATVAFKYGASSFSSPVTQNITIA